MALKAPQPPIRAVCFKNGEIPNPRDFQRADPDRDAGRFELYVIVHSKPGGLHAGGLLCVNCRQ